MPYTIHSDFNPKLHKQTFIHYLEVIIDENGKIMYAVPSHQEKMIKLAFTAEQIKALQMLKNDGLYLGEIPRMEVGLNVFSTYGNSKAL